jgi:hypothetical protein
MIARIHHNVAVNEFSLAELSSVYDLAPHPCQRENVIAETVFNENLLGDWYGEIKSFADIRVVLDNGWVKGAQKLEALISSSPDVQGVKSRKRIVEWKSEGDDLHLDRAIRGDWDRAWRSSRREWSSGTRALDLFTLYGGSCSLSSDQIFWIGATSAIVTSAIEKAGYAVRLHACFLHVWSDFVGRHDIVLKDYNEPLRLDGIASVLCHSGVYRTFGFRSWMQMPKPLSCGLGPAAYRWEPVIPEMRACEEWDDNCIYINPAHDRSSCIAEVDRIISKIEDRAR